MLTLWMINTVDDQEPEIVDPENILDDHELLCPPLNVPSPRHLHIQKCTNKHKVKWHDAAPESDEIMKQAYPNRDFEDAV